MNEDMPDIPRDDKCHLLLRNLSRVERDMFKGFCSRRGSNMTEEIRRFMRQCIFNDTKLDLPKYKRNRRKKDDA